MSQQRVEAVERALSILEAFGERADRLSLAQIAEETGLYKSTILRLAASVETEHELATEGTALFVTLVPAGEDVELAKAPLPAATSPLPAGVGTAEDPWIAPALFRNT